MTAAGRSVGFWSTTSRARSTGWWRASAGRQIGGLAACLALTTVALVGAGPPGFGWSHELDWPVVLEGSDTTELGFGAGNVYAPEILRDGDRWVMWYGGQGQDGSDRIHLATSTDLRHWTKHGVVLDLPETGHDNDPSVVCVEGVFHMYWTLANLEIIDGQFIAIDEIVHATSTDGVKWQDAAIVLPATKDGTWDSLVIGRPSVIYDDGVFRMWYDGRSTSAGPNSVGYAESTDGVNWVKQPDPVLPGRAAVHVSVMDGGYLMVIQSGTGTDWATSPDGFVWTTQPQLVAADHATADAYGHVTPFLLRPPGADPVLFVGGAEAANWAENHILGFDLDRSSVPSGPPSVDRGCDVTLPAGAPATTVHDSSPTVTQPAGSGVPIQVEPTFTG